MSVTREDIADLREGDVIELSNRNWHGAVVKGPVHNMETGYLCVGEYAIARPDGEPFPGDRDLTLTVVSRAPRPLYANHPRPAPMPGDVVRSDDDSNPWTAWRDTHDAWLARDRHVIHPLMMPARLRLLVDGETGQVVP